MADSLITGDMLTENPKPGTYIRICGIPKRQDGTYYCPYCNFESDDIEDFAISMCWDCVYSEDQEETTLETDEIKKGDVVKLTKEITVNAVGSTGFYDGEGRFYGNSKDRESGFDVELVSRTPEHMPPQEGDIWLGPDNTEWYIFSVGGMSFNALRAMTSPHDGETATNVGMNKFKTMAVQLLHRRGDRND